MSYNKNLSIALLRFRTFLPIHGSFKNIFNLEKSVLGMVGYIIFFLIFSPSFFFTLKPQSLTKKKIHSMVKKDKVKSNKPNSSQAIEYNSDRGKSSTYTAQLLRKDSLEFVLSGYFNYSTRKYGEVLDKREGTQKVWKNIRKIIGSNFMIINKRKKQQDPFEIKSSNLKFYLLDKLTISALINPILKLVHLYRRNNTHHVSRASIAFRRYIIKDLLPNFMEIKKNKANKEQQDKILEIKDKIALQYEQSGMLRSPHVFLYKKMKIENVLYRVTSNIQNKSIEDRENIYNFTKEQINTTPVFIYGKDSNKIVLLKQKKALQKSIMSPILYALLNLVSISIIRENNEKENPFMKKQISSWNIMLAFSLENMVSSTGIMIKKNIEE